ncbi:hypothetical protein KAW18_06210 [candidate division WOR-3 bacterium]|nr:hypothetical protein [candidate division WOR-3 bacterium]MCK4526946.1 hypothetical protein [candidate division WOR-3 bacterium]
MKKRVPLLITFITGFIVIVSFFVPHRPFGALETETLIWYSIILGFTLLIGVDSLVRLHTRQIRRKKKGWWYSIVFFAGFFYCLTIGIISLIRTPNPFQPGTVFFYGYETILIPLQSTMFALLAFFVASASYRAFRARNLDATLLLITAVIVMIGRVPAGHKLWTRLPGIANWVFDVLQMGPMRGIMIGVALGAVAMSLRLILGIERTYLS